jgi:hypothetical protein
MNLDQLTKFIENALIEREKVRQEYGGLFDEVSAILFRIDPISINFKTNTDEYETEVGTILPRLRACNSLVDARRIIHQEFVRWFSEKIAGPETRYQQAAEYIWAAWQIYLKSSGKP